MIDDKKSYLLLQTSPGCPHTSYGNKNSRPQFWDSDVILFILWLPNMSTYSGVKTPRLWTTSHVGQGQGLLIISFICILTFCSRLAQLSATLPTWKWTFSRRGMGHPRVRMKETSFRSCPSPLSTPLSSLWGWMCPGELSPLSGLDMANHLSQVVKRSLCCTKPPRTNMIRLKSKNMLWVIIE